MKFDVLHNFISPVTGRVLADYNYVLVGNRQGIAIPSPILIDIRLDLINLRKRYNSLTEADFIIGHPNEQIPNAQVLSDLVDGFMYNTAGVVSTTPTIPIGSLPDLQDNYIWIGGVVDGVHNRPVPQPRIFLNNLPNLTTKYIWRGVGDRPVESDDLTTLEEEVKVIDDKVTALEEEVRVIEGEIEILQAQVSALETAVGIIEGEIAAIELEILGIQAELLLIEGTIAGLLASIAVIQGQIIAINIRIDNLRLNNIPAGGDVSLDHFKIINLADPLCAQDAVNLRTLENYIPVSFDITLIGDVIGNGPSNLPIITTMVKTLNNINNAGDININNFKLSNVADPFDSQDAVNLRTLNSYIGAINLDGFVISGPPVGGLIETFRGPTCTLDVIPAADDVSFSNFAITDLETLSFSSWADMENKAQNGINFLFLWQLFGGGIR